MGHHWTFDLVSWQLRSDRPVPAIDSWGYHMTLLEALFGAQPVHGRPNLALNSVAAGSNLPFCVVDPVAGWPSGMRTESGAVP